MSHILDLYDAIRHINHKIKRIEVRERAEQAGAVKAVLFADVPAAGKPGRLLFVTDALKDGETTGNGTGTLAYDDGVAWRRVADDTTLGN